MKKLFDDLLAANGPPPKSVEQRAAEAIDAGRKQIFLAASAYLETCSRYAAELGWTNIIAGTDAELAEKLVGTRQMIEDMWAGVSSGDMPVIRDEPTPPAIEEEAAPE